MFVCYVAYVYLFKTIPVNGTAAAVEIIMIVISVTDII